MRILRDNSSSVRSYSRPFTGFPGRKADSFPINLERVLVAALIIGIAGLGGIVWCVMQWADAGFGPLQYGALIRVLTVSITGVALALQLAFTAFLSGMLEIEL